MKRREFVRTCGLGAAALAASRCAPVRPAGTPRPAGRPNILFIMSDDHAAHSIGAYGSRVNRTPHIDRLAREGVRFDNCFSTDGICAPSRAVILTGKHSHLNGVRDNAVAFDGAQPTLPKLLQAAGYQTALLGKWHLKSDPTGFDYWSILPGQGEYYNPEFIEMGDKRTHPGYCTDLLTEMALRWLRTGRDPGRPFFLMLHHKAPHRNWQPAPRHLRRYDGLPIPEPATLFDDYATRSAAAREQEMTVRDHLTLESDLKLGPPPARMDEEQQRAWEDAYGPKREEFFRQKPEGEALVRWKYRRYMEDYLSTIEAVDESVGRVLDELDASGLAPETLVVYASDQGFFLGDHGWFDKRFMYEEALRMPLLMRLPGFTSAGSARSELVQNLDFAPTFLDLAGLVPPADMQGASFVPFLRGERPRGWRRSVYYHYYEYPAVHMVKRHYGVRTTRYKLMHFYYDMDAWELYDLKRDPQELRNVYDDPGYAGVRENLRLELRRLQALYGDSDELAQRLLEEDLARVKGTPD